MSRQPLTHLFWTRGLNKDVMSVSILERGRSRVVIKVKLPLEARNVRKNFVELSEADLPSFASEVFERLFDVLHCFLVGFHPSCFLQQTPAIAQRLEIRRPVAVIDQREHLIRCDGVLQAREPVVVLVRVIPIVWRVRITLHWIQLPCYPGLHTVAIRWLPSGLACNCVTIVHGTAALVFCFGPLAVREPLHQLLESLLVNTLATSLHLVIVCEECLCIL